MENLIVKSKVKEVVRGFKVSGTFCPALNKLIHELIHKAEERAEANGRRTVDARDL